MAKSGARPWPWPSMRWDPARSSNRASWPLRLRAMARAIQDLALVPEMVLVDGHQPLPLTYPQQPVIKGDDRCPSIAAASVVAKVYRDRLMEALHHRYPQYNFARHKGYATPEHLEALRCWGPCAPPPPHLPGREGVAGRRGMMWHRKSPRLSGYDYSQEGAYFVTVCVQGRQALLGEDS